MSKALTSVQIPSHMEAVVARAAKVSVDTEKDNPEAIGGAAAVDIKQSSALTHYSIERVPVPNLQAGYALVKLEAASLNRRDEWIRLGLYPGGIKYGSTIGGDGAGVLVAIGEPKGSHDSTYSRVASRVGKPVVLNACMNWGSRTAGSSSSFGVLGMSPYPGTFAQYICLPLTQVYASPPHLSFSQAATLPIAALTAFRLLTTITKAIPGDTVLITGIGGGVAIFALQFALALGCRVIVTSSSKKKIERAIQLGAAAGFLYTDSNWGQQIKDFCFSTGGTTKDYVGVDVCIDGSGGDGLNRLLSVISSGGRIGVYGATAGAPQQLNVYSLFLKNVSLCGSSMGTDAEFEKMCEFVEKHSIVPVLDSIWQMSEIGDALKRMVSPESFGKVVINIPHGEAGPGMAKL